MLPFATNIPNLERRGRASLSTGMMQPHVVARRARGLGSATLQSCQEQGDVLRESREMKLSDYSHAAFISSTPGALHQTVLTDATWKSD